MLAAAVAAVGWKTNNCSGMIWSRRLARSVFIMNVLGIILYIYISASASVCMFTVQETLFNVVSTITEVTQIV